MNTSDRRHVVEQAPSPVGAYPHSLRVGDFLFLSGVGPREPGTSVVPGNQYDENGRLTAYDFAAQCQSVFRNVRVILEQSGAKWEQLIDVTCFLTNMQNDFKLFNRLYAEAFPGQGPCRTTVEVNALPTPIAIELKCIAYLGGTIK